MTPPTIIWFRQDLRIADNPALAAARAADAPAIALYVYPDGETPERPIGGAASWWLHHSLAALSESLEAIGVPLVLAAGDPRRIVPELARDLDAAAVFWNRRYEAAARAVDEETKATLKAAGVRAASYNGHLLNEPWQIAKADSDPYRVFTPYWNAVLRKGPPDRPIPAPTPFPAPSNVPDGNRLADWKLANADISSEAWQPGEDGAVAALTAFLDGMLPGYARHRDRPNVAGTSRLSPHLRFGEISPRTIWHAVDAHAHEAGGAAEKFLSELAWREFSYHLLYHVPDIATANIQDRFDHFPWAEPGAALRTWQRGETGYPLVDAGMRELAATGWMHNRVRMVTASFLTKHLRIDWRHGEAWFWDRLVDADPANNPASWQWVAGSGADAAPYFRIFNPVLQGEKFDPDGAYVRKWVPAMASLPDRWIHKPWKAPAHVLDEAGVNLGDDYPHPIVDHSSARKAALEAWRRSGDDAREAA